MGKCVLEYQEPTLRDLQLSDGKKGIHRSQRVLLQKEGISRYTSVAINQAVIEQTILDLVSQKGRFHVEKDMLPESSPDRITSGR